MLSAYSLRSESKRAGGEELSKRQERALRILAAASELTQRWGYKKTAVDDIARLAGVAKGTIYLHWKTREDLFVALLLHESREALNLIVERIASDPAGISLSNMVKHYIYVVLTRPLARALFTQDASVLGELLQQGREDLETLTQQKLVAGQHMLDFFRAKGALRTDQSIPQQLKMYSTMVMGTMIVDQYMPQELQSTPEEASALLAAMIHATLEPAEPITPEVQHELQTVWDHYVQQLTSLLDERLQKELA